MSVALTRIVHGVDDKRTVIEYGETVKGLPADVVKDLKEQGLIGELPGSEITDERDELLARVAELEAKLNAQNQQPPNTDTVGQASGPQHSGNPNKTVEDKK